MGSNIKIPMGSGSYSMELIKPSTVVIVALCCVIFIECSLLINMWHEWYVPPKIQGVYYEDASSVSSIDSVSGGGTWTTPDGNCAITSGSRSLESTSTITTCEITTGTNNVSLGYFAGTNNSTGTSNTWSK